MLLPDFPVRLDCMWDLINRLLKIHRRYCILCHSAHFCCKVGTSPPKRVLGKDIYNLTIAVFIYPWDIKGGNIKIFDGCTHVFLQIYFLRKKQLNTSEMLIRQISIKLGAILKFSTLYRILSIFLIRSMFFFQIQHYRNEFDKSWRLQKESLSALSKDVPGYVLAKTKPSLMQ